MRTSFLFLISLQFNRTCGDYILFGLIGVVMKSRWTKDDFKQVTVLTLGNGIWLSAISWLVLGYWLEYFSFFACVSISIVFSWIVAIWRTAKNILRREEDPFYEMKRIEDEWKGRQ
ncbi:hypothetical protein [Thalassospira australica]|uniref:hypothetical protein n=1 Tax=Thalassospira australica TaxID=1528106 RepID=UPI000519FA6B|nr:hypothetical protein [Thalassospira australica]